MKIHYPLLLLLGMACPAQTLGQPTALDLLNRNLARHLRVCREIQEQNVALYASVFITIKNDVVQDSLQYTRNLPTAQRAEFRKIIPFLKTANWQALFPGSQGLHNFVVLLPFYCSLEEGSFSTFSGTELLRFEQADQQLAHHTAAMVFTLPRLETHCYPTIRCHFITGDTVRSTRSLITPPKIIPPAPSPHRPRRWRLF
ncbi:MAG TPA: hypothetical protein VGC22_01120 [Chitinophaga sp.]